MEQNNSTSSTDITKIHEADLKAVFASHLNRIYCGKAHLVKRLPEISSHATFKDLKHAIDETKEDVEKQLLRMMRIFKMIDSFVSEESCVGLTSLIEETFDAIRQANGVIMRDMSILFYMQNIESVEMTSFNILKIIADKLYDDEIKQLLKENYDEAREDRLLLSLVSSKYIHSN
jgi:ferritin-like metal-binding protein YciE